MIYVDELVDHGCMVPDWLAKRCGTVWCHMWADNEEELHIFAQNIGLKRSWFQDKRLKHYDLTPNKRALAVLCGAKQVKRWTETLDHWKGLPQFIAADFTGKVDVSYPPNKDYGIKNVTSDEAYTHCMVMLAQHPEIDTMEFLFMERKNGEGS